MIYSHFIVFILLTRVHTMYCFNLYCFNDVIIPINMENLQIFLHFNLDAEECARLLQNVVVWQEVVYKIVLVPCAMQVQQRFIKYLD